jgi:predicted amidophosphoribosyltransferase
MPLLDRVLDLLAPPSCLACGVPGADLCGACRRALPWLSAARCRRCGLPGPCGGTRRPACPAAPLGFDAAWAPAAYAGPAQALVGALKFRGRRIALEPMSAAMAQAPWWLLGDTPDVPAVLVPVPTARKRVRSRGFDQAHALAAALQQRGVGRVTACLERGASEVRQLGAPRAARLAPGRLDVRVRAGAAPPASCVLVDDVHTTGATLDACARALKAAGARRVTALTYARALP